MTFWLKPEFISLQQQWYKRLKDSGFDDQEDSDDDYRLRCLIENMRLKCPLLLRVDIEYFEKILEAYENNETENETDKLIMHLYVGGARINEIEEHLKKNGQRKARNTIRFIIRKYEHRWQIKQYTRKQLNLK